MHTETHNDDPRSVHDHNAICGGGVCIALMAIDLMTKAVSCE